MKQLTMLNKEIAEYRQKFYKLYNTTIKPLFMEYEKERKSILYRAICYSVLCIMLDGVFALMVFSPENVGKSPEFVFVILCTLMISAFVAALAIPFYMDYKFAEKLKQSCMGKLLNLFGNIRWYQEKEVISDAELNASGLFANYNRREVDDGFSGVYKDVPFDISETGMTLVTGSGKNRSEERIFKGVVIKFRANKDIKNRTIVAPKWDTKIKEDTIGPICGIVAFIFFIYIQVVVKYGFNIVTLFLAIIISITAIIVFSGHNEEAFNEVKLEDVEFSKKYKVYSSDQIESRFLITPAFMERFKNIQTAFGTNNVKCSFYGDSLMFAISTNKNLFELGSLFHSLENPKQLETFFNELTSIFLLVDYFKLDEHTNL